MAQRFPSVAIVGVSLPSQPNPLGTLTTPQATGNIGLPILRALSQAQPPFESITVLTRSPPSNPSILPQGVIVKVVDYTSSSSLIPALTGIDALVFAVGTRYTLSQIPIIEAAVDAGVKFIIPTEYSLASTLPPPEASNAWAAKRKVRTHLAGLREAGKLDYTLIFAGLWIDVLGLTWVLIDVKNKKQELWEGGEHPISLTSTGSVGEAVVAVLEGKAAGKTEVRIKNINLSQRRIKELSEEVVGEDGWEVTHLDTEESTKIASQRLREGTAEPADHYSFVKRGAAVWGYAGPWTSEEDDSAALGLEEWTEGDVVQLIREIVGSKEQFC
jgi:uncharacterized protein YbjT (DUF2867 family)